MCPGAVSGRIAIHPSCPRTVTACRPSLRRRYLSRAIFRPRHGSMGGGVVGHRAEKTISEHHAFPAGHNGSFRSSMKGADKASFMQFQACGLFAQPDSAAFVGDRKADRIAVFGPGAVVIADLVAKQALRSDARRVGKECVSTCSIRGAPYH